MYDNEIGDIELLTMAVRESIEIRDRFVGDCVNLSVMVIESSAFSLLILYHFLHNDYGIS